MWPLSLFEIRNIYSKKHTNNKDIDKKSYDSTNLIVLPGRSFYYPAAAGDVEKNSVVASAIGYIGRTITDVPMFVERDGKKIYKHAILDLIENPNDYYSGDDLLITVVKDVIVSGNAYILIKKDSRGLPINLVYVRPSDCSLKLKSYGVPAYYSIKADALSSATNVSVEDVIHFRYGLNPYTLNGESPLSSCTRDIAADNEAATYVSSILRNMGTPGLIISPFEDETITQDQADVLKHDVVRRTTGEARGEPIVLTSRIKIDKIDSFDPSKVSPAALRSMATERICSTLGIPPIVLGIDLKDSSSYANMETARQIARESCLKPWMSLISSTFTKQLLPYFELSNSKIMYDISNW